MKKISLIILMICCSFVFVSGTFAADVAKIGVVSVQRILNESSAGKMIQKKLSAKQKEIIAKMNTEKNEIDKMIMDFRKEVLVLSPEKQEEKARIIRIRKNDFNEMDKKLTREFKKLQEQLLKQFRKDITAIVNELGNSQGYLLILEKKESAVVFSPAQIDITETIIKLYNKKAASQ